MTQDATGRGGGAGHHRLSPGGVTGAVVGAVLGGAAAAGAVGAGRARSRVLRQRARLSEEEQEHPSELGLLPRGREPEQRRHETARAPPASVLEAASPS